jgi:DeoR family transcriptional regulator of aga operon
MELSQRKDFSVTVVVGPLRGGWFSLVGAQAIAAVRESCLDRVFIGVNAIDPERGLTCHHSEEAAVNRTLLGQARERIVVADRSKLGREVHMLITNCDAPDAAIAPFAGRGIEVRQV